MGTVTRDEVLLVYAYCLLILRRVKKKHLRVPSYVADHVREKMQPFWGLLTDSERLAFLFALHEREYMDLKYIGPRWKIIVSVAWLKDKTADLAANFVVHSDKRLN